MFHCQQGSPIKVHDVKSPEVPAEGPWSPQYTGPLLLLETSTEALSASLPHNYLVCVCHYHACWNHYYALMWWLPLLITNMSAPWVEDVNTLQRLSCKAPHHIIIMNSGQQNIAQEWIPRERYIDSKVLLYLEICMSLPVFCDNLSTHKMNHQFGFLVCMQSNLIWFSPWALNPPMDMM